MKVVFLIRSLALAGAEKQLVVLANGLAKLGHTVKVVVFYSGGELESKLEGVSLHHFSKKSRWDVSFLPRLVEFLKAEEADIVHGYMGLGNILATLCRPFFQKGVLIWGIRASNMDLSAYDVGARVSFELERVLSRFAAGIIVNSYSGMEHAASVGFPSKKMKVIPNGIDNCVYSSDQSLGIGFRNDLGLDSDVPLFGLVGRVDTMKGHDVFIRAAAEIVATGREAVFVCVGKLAGDFGRDMKKLARSFPELNGRFFWLDRRVDVVPVHNGLDVLVSASRFGEGFSNVIGEAMACGTPCVVTNVGDSARIVGDTGIVVAPDDHKALARGMAKMMDRLSEESELGRRCRSRVEDNFSTDGMVATTESYLSDKLLKACNE